MTVPDLTRGSRSADTGAWQRFLNETQGAGLTVDEDFGPRTFDATVRWQRAEGLPITGAVSSKERVVAALQGYIPFIQAKNYTPLYPGKTRKIDLIVIHTMENPEKPGMAENVAYWFAGLTSYAAPIASAHYCLDSQNTFQTVRDVDVAWHAPGANNNGIGIEHNGYAAQTPLQWDDTESRLILERSAKLAARLVGLYDVPIARLSVQDVVIGARGFCGHVDVTHAFPGPKRDHQDPGLNFPWPEYLDLIRAACDGAGS